MVHPQHPTRLSSQHRRGRGGSSHRATGAQAARLTSLVGCRDAADLDLRGSTGMERVHAEGQCAHGAVMSREGSLMHLSLLREEARRPVGNSSSPRALQARKRRRRASRSSSSPRRTAPSPSTTAWRIPGAGRRGPPERQLTPAYVVFFLLTVLPVFPPGSRLRGGARGAWLLLSRAERGSEECAVGLERPCEL